MKVCTNFRRQKQLRFETQKSQTPWEKAKKMAKAHLNPANRMAAIILFDATMSNPNGDPDARNVPRHHSDGIGVVTSGCIKRKIRDYIHVEYGDQPRYDLFIKKGSILNENIDSEAQDLELGSKPAKENHALRDQQRATVLNRVKERFFDVRMFGQVMGTGVTGKALALPSIRGPITVSYAQSYHPVELVNLSITRVAATKTEDRGKDTEMGRGTVVRYGLYAAKVYYTPTKDNQISEEDMSLFWEAVENMFANDKSAARPEMRMRKVVIFSQVRDANMRGKGHFRDDELLDRVRVKLRDDISSDLPLRFEDYEITVPTQSEMPENVELTVY